MSFDPSDGDLPPGLAVAFGEIANGRPAGGVSLHSGARLLALDAFATPDGDAEFASVGVDLVRT